MNLRQSLSIGLAAALCCGAFVTAQAAPVELQLALRPSGGGGSATSGQEFAQKVIALFEARHPDIHVTYTPLTGSWQDKLTAEMIAGDAPDVFEMWGQFANDWGDRGLLTDLNPLVKTDFTPAEIADFYPGQWQSTIQVGGPHAGMRIGLPRYVNDGIMFYNADAFSAAGLTDPDTLEQSDQWTTDAFRSAAKKLTRRDAAGTVQMWGFSEPYWAEWVFDFGGKVFDWPQRPLDFVMDQPASLQALQFIRDLIWQDQTMVPEASDEFADGKVGMTESYGSCCIGDIRASVGDKFAWNVAPLPVAPGGVRHSWIGKDMYGLAASSKHPREAWELLKFLVSPEVQAIDAQIIGEQPVRISAMRAYQAAYPGVNVQYAAEMGQVALPWPTYVLPQSEKVGALLDQVIADSIWTQKKSIQGAISAARPAIEALLAEK